MGQVELYFESEISASPARAWEWITSIEGISQELWPYFRMTAPPGVKSIGDLTIKLGQPLFRSRVYLLGFLPIDHSDITLIEMKEGEGFIEESPTGSMNLWRHERRIVPTSNGCKVTDHLTFEPKRAASVVAWYMRTAFHHRHRVLRRNLNRAA